MTPKLKPLAWAERTEGLWRADDPTGGCYEVIELSESRAACHHVVRGYGVNIGSTHQSVDDAQAAAQAHHDAHIIAALDPAWLAHIAALEAQVKAADAMAGWLRRKSRDIETGEIMYDDARADIYVGEILEILAAAIRKGEPQ